jgi:hypothetical protein
MQLGCLFKLRKGLLPCHALLSSRVQLLGFLMLAFAFQVNRKGGKERDFFGLANLSNHKNRNEYVIDVERLKEYQ